MKRILRATTLALLVILAASLAAFAVDLPNPIGHVNDFANILSPSMISSLEERLGTLEKDTSAQVAVVTIDTIGDISLQEYAVQLFEKWGIGQKGKDNGVLFIISLKEGDVRIEVGYGLESIITDGRAGRILDNEVLPYFTSRDFDGGVEAGVIAIENYIRDGTPPSVIEENSVQKVLNSFKLPLYWLVILGIISIYILGFMARTKSIWLGGIWGIICGLILGLGFGGLLWVILLPLGMGVGGILLDIILSANYKSLNSSGHSTGWFSSGGGFRGGGFGGGFGGFGGGRSGGGGAGRKF